MVPKKYLDTIPQGCQHLFPDRDNFNGDAFLS